MSFIQFFIGGIAFTLGIVTVGAIAAVTGLVIKARTESKKLKAAAAAEARQRAEAEAAAEAQAATQAQAQAAPVAEAAPAEPGVYPDLQGVLHQGFVIARTKKKQEMTREIFALALLDDSAVRARLDELGVDRGAIGRALEALIDAQADGLSIDDVQPSADFTALIATCIKQQQVEPLGALHVVLMERSTPVGHVFAATGLTAARLQAPFPVEPPLDVPKLSDMLESPSLPPKQEKILRRIVDAVSSANVLRLASGHGAATICLMDIQDRDERQAAFSIARLMADRMALHLPASSLDSHFVAIRQQLAAAAASGERLLLWISGVAVTFAEVPPVGHAMPNADAFIRLMEQCQSLPATVCVLHAFDSQHLDAARLRRAVPNAFQVAWPLPEVDERQRQIESLCERQPALTLIEPDRPGWVAELVRMTEGLTAGDVSEIFSRAERMAVMSGAAAPDFTMLSSSLEDLHRHSRRRNQGTLGEAPYVRSQARVRMGTGSARGLDALAGMEDVKKELRRYRGLVLDRDRFIVAGCRVPRGLLLKGNPGVGKTAVARAFADSLGRPFFSAVGSEFIELYVGVGAARVRDLFKSARQAQPCVVFIDELDAIGGRRDGMSNRESTSTLNQLLVEMDGFDPSEGVFVMGATNRVDILDPALTRAGRFDAIIEVPIPDDHTRAAILRLLLGQRHSLSDEDIASFVETTNSFVGAELESMVNRARVDAVSNGGDGCINRAQLEESLAHALGARPDELLDNHDDDFFR